MADIELVKGETVDVYVVLADRDGPIPDGTFSTITYDLFSGGSRQQTVTGTALANGRVKFSFDATDTSVPGIYQGHVRAERSSTSRLFFPSERPHVVVIRDAPTS